MAPLRRQPSQQRSRERVERILAAAADLLAEGGPDALRPSDVAARAEVPIGSLYQYFDDKNAILESLIERYFERIRDTLTRCIAGKDTLDEVLDGMALASRQWLVMHREEPMWTQVAYGILGDKALQQANVADSHRNADLLAGALLAVAPEADAASVRDVVLVTNHLFPAALQLALAEPTPARQDAVFEAWLAMATREVRWVARERSGPVSDAGHEAQQEIGST